MEALSNSLAPLLPSLLAVAPSGEGSKNIGWGIFFYSAIVLLVIFGFAIGMRRGITNRTFTTPTARLAEQAYLFVENLCISVIGSHGRRYVPFILTLWLTIFVGNFIGLVLPHTPSADWSLNLALALIVFLYVQYEGMRANGVFGHVGHFAGPRLALWMAVLITPLIFAIELFSEFLKILTLSVRLYGNIYAGHVARGTMDAMVSPLQVGPYQIPIPFGVIILPIEVLVSIVQAFVFVLLTCIYLSLVTGHGDEEHAEHGGQTESAPAGARAA